MLRTALALALAIIAPAAANAANQGQVMVLGTHHLANNNRDLINLPIEDITTPARQSEITRMVDALAFWKPTRVVVEWSYSDQAGLDHRYAAYLAGKLKLSANERDQIAFRLAKRLGHRKVYAIDWNGRFPGQDSNYDFVNWAKRNGQAERFDRFVADGQTEANRTAEEMHGQTISQWYRALNTPEHRLRMHQPYFTIASFGTDQENPGAAWVGGWYTRNLRIFNSLAALVKPGERVFVLYGVGHTYLLDSFIRESGAAKLVDPRDYLPEK